LARWSVKTLKEKSHRYGPARAETPYKPEIFGRNAPKVTRIIVNITVTFQLNLARFLVSSDHTNLKPLKNWGGNAMPTATEAASERFQRLDQWKTTDILEALWAGQSRAVASCLSALPAVERAVEDAAARLGSNGRLIYVGAGSSGLIAALDALELASTFDWPEDRLAIVLAGGLISATGSTAGRRMTRKLPAPGCAS
jgi:hypothetical protein